MSDSVNRTTSHSSVDLKTWLVLEAESNSNDGHPILWYSSFHDSQAQTARHRLQSCAGRMRRGILALDIMANVAR